MYNIEKVWKDWKVIRLIGEGSSGKVYEIVRDNMGIEEHSALKVITIPQSQSEVRLFLNEGMDEKSVTEYYQSIVKDFINEISIMSKLKGNPNIVAYEDYQVVEHDNEVGWDIIIRMELLKSFSDFIGEKQLTEEEIIKFGIEMCEALSVCHKNNIVHRDIKYDNIFISDAGIYKLGDFGVAKTLEKTSGSFSIKGTYTYMAPEVYKGESYGVCADIYSLGMVMYKLLNYNREPFLPLPPEIIRVSDRDNALVKRMQGVKLSPPINASERMREIILKACAFNFKDRYSSVDELKNELNMLRYPKLHSEKSALGQSNEMTDSVVKHDNGSTNADKTVSIFNSEENLQESEAKNVGKTTKSKKLMIIIAAAVIVVLVSVIGFSSLNSNKKSDDDMSSSLSNSSILNSSPNSEDTNKIVQTQTEAVFETVDSEENSKQIAYETGLNLLESYIYDSSEETIKDALEEFEKADDYEYASDYLTISNACLESDADTAVSILKNYAYDEYVQRILLMDKYVLSFFKDSQWHGDIEKGTDSTLYLDFDMNCYTDYNLPCYGYDVEEMNDLISYYNFIDGKYTVFFADDSELEFWEFKILDENHVKVYCYDTEQTIYLKRF